MGRKPLVSKEQVLQTLNRLIVQHGFAPSIEELRQALHLGSTRTVLRYLEALEGEGHIRRWRGARGIQPLRSPTNGAETVPIPLVGEVPAGQAMLAEESREGWVRLPREFVRSQSAKYFLLRVRGDSMNRARVSGERIENGDLVLIRQQSTAQTGDVVVALIDGEATIKRLAKAPGYWLLKPESTNPVHHPIILHRDFGIQGVVCRVLKKGSELIGLLEE
jgi:repressor LexA